MSNELSAMTHIYAGNPLDRGDQERRDEDWLRDAAGDPATRFLPLWENTVLVANTPGARARLDWAGRRAAAGHRG